MNPIIETPTGFPAFAPECLWVFLTALAVFALLTFWIRIDAARHLSEVLRIRRDPRLKGDVRPKPAWVWDLLYERAETVVEDTVAALPREIKAEAMKLPCLFRERAQELYGRSAFGIYHGFKPGLVADTGGFIVLFLDDLHRYCAEHELYFEQEVRTTYLHELGHQIGRAHV